MKRQNKHFRCRGQFSCQLVLQPSPRVTAAFCNYAPRWNRNSLLTLLRHFSRVTPTAGKQSTRSTFGMSLGHISPPMFTLSSSKHQGIPISSVHHAQPRAKHASLQQRAAQRIRAHAHEHCCFCRHHALMRAVGHNVLTSLNFFRSGIAHSFIVINIQQSSLQCLIILRRYYLQRNLECVVGPP